MLSHAIRSAVRMESCTCAAHTHLRRRSTARAPASMYDAPGCDSIGPAFFFDFLIALRPARRSPSDMAT